MRSLRENTDSFPASHIADLLRAWNIDKGDLDALLARHKGSMVAGSFPLAAVLLHIGREAGHKAGYPFVPNDIDIWVQLGNETQHEDHGWIGPDAAVPQDFETFLAYRGFREVAPPAPRNGRFKPYVDMELVIPHISFFESAAGKKVQVIYTYCAPYCIVRYRFDISVCGVSYFARMLRNLNYETASIFTHANAIEDIEAAQFHVNPGSVPSPRLLVRVLKYVQRGFKFVPWDCTRDRKLVVVLRALNRFAPAYKRKLWAPEHPFRAATKRTLAAFQVAFRDYIWAPDHPFGARKMLEGRARFQEACEVVGQKRPRGLAGGPALDLAAGY